MNQPLINVIVVGVVFFFLFTSHQTSSIIQQFVISSTIANRNGTGPTTSDNAGYYAASILFGSFTTCNLITPALIEKWGEKVSMLIASIIYVGFMMAFFYISNYLLYTGSALLGFAASLLWLAQGTYLAKNSDDKTAGRNAGIFFAIFETSFVIGGLIVYFQFANDMSDDDEQDQGLKHQKSAHLSSGTIFSTYVAFSIITAIGALILCFLKSVPKKHDIDSSSSMGVDERNQEAYCKVVLERTNSTSGTTTSCNPKNIRKADSSVFANLVASLSNMVSMLGTKPVLFMIVVFLFSGLSPAFMTGVYGTSLANTLAFPAHKSLLALNVVMIGIGEILGGSIFGIFGKKLNRFGRKPIVVFALFVSMTCYSLIFVNLPTEANFSLTHDRSLINPPSQVLALCCSLLLGFADACWNTQIYAFISVVLDGNAGAFGLFRFFQSAASCASFFYSGLIYLQWQLSILMVMCPLACAAFLAAESCGKPRIARV